jgi:hypothetical protein
MIRHLIRGEIGAIIMTRTLICHRCGIEGDIAVLGINSDNPSICIFRHVGHNPFSGHLHYQCPVCGIILSVDSMTVLEFLISELSKVDTIDAGVTKTVRLPHNGSLLPRLFQNQPANSR